MIELNERDLARLGGFVLEYSGITLDRIATKGVQERVSQFITSLGMESFDDFWLLLRSSNGDAVRGELISRITVSESFFFRNPGQFRYIAWDLLPEFLAKRTKHGEPIKMWSAGCATGEETYSLAFVAMWFKTRHPEAVFQLTGTDINPHNIEHAGQATYRARSFRKCSKEFQQEFAYSLGREVRDEFKVDSRLQKVVHFRILNLRDLPGLKCLSGLDIILCRNVLIYFEDRFRQDLIRTFHGLLKPGGMLFLGETESLPHMPDLFRLVNCHGAYGYARVDDPEKTA